MALFEIKPIEDSYVEVDYLGGTISIPSHHVFVAMTKLDCANGETKGLLVSYEVEPTVSRNGYYVAVPGTDSRILSEVEYQDPRGSLRRVQGHNQEELILANTEELVYKFAQVLASDQSNEDKVHTMFCPEHGIFMDFMKHTAPSLADHFDQEDDQNEEDEDADMPTVSIKALTPNGIIDLSDELPPELDGILCQIASALKS